MTWYDMIWHDI